MFMSETIPCILCSITANLSKEKKKRSNYKFFNLKNEKMQNKKLFFF